MQALTDDYGAAAAEAIAEQTQTLSAARAQHDRLEQIWGFPYGDIDGSGKIDAGDALAALQHSVSLRTLTDDQFRRADVDGSGKVDSSDALYILQYSVELISDFPVQR